MTPTIGLKRFGIAIAVVIAVIVAAFAALPLLIRAEAVREAVQSEIRAAAGFERLVLGAASISSFPSSSARFSDVVLRDPDSRPAITAERLTARLRFLPLLLGRIELSEITLLRPQVLIEVDAAGRSNWDGPLGRLSQTPPGKGPGRPMSFSEVRFVDGTVIIYNQARGVTETLHGVELSLAWPAISKSFGASGHFIWRDEKIDASATVSDFLGAVSGERSGFKLRVNGAPFKLAFDGHLGYRPTLKIDGTVAADSASLRNALRWAGQEPLPGSGFERFALKAQAAMVGRTLSLSGVNLELDGNAAEGVLTVSVGERPMLQGTLAAEEINVTPYVAGVRLRGSQRDWNRMPINLGGFASVDFDLRISASRIVVPGSKLGRTAVGASLRGGRLGLNIGESQAFGGVLKGSLGLAKTDTGADVKTQLQFTNIDLEASLGALFGVRRLEGRGDLAVALEASGTDIEAWSRALNGTISLVAKKGAVAGLNVEQLLRRLERRPLSGAGDFRSGRTPFDSLAINVKIVDGTATVENVKLLGSGVRLALGGSASIPSRALDLQGLASLVATPAVNGVPFELPFIVHGRWDDPVMLPDVQSLIQRSGAAAPLLDAARSGRSREAVRSAIEQLTGAASGQPQTPVAETPAPAATTAPSEAPTAAAVPAEAPAAATPAR